MQIESGVFSLKFQKGKFCSNGLSIYTYTHTHTRVRAHTWYRDIQNKRVKLLREEWLKIDKNIFVRNIPRCFPTSVLQYSRRQFANISL